MKFIFSILLTALLAFALGLYLPWWSLALAAFLVAALITLKPGWAFLAGFLSVFLLWALMAWIMSSGNDHILAHRVSQVIIKQDSPGTLVLVTGLVGGLVGGFAALSGRYLRLLLAGRAG
jgi:hypothetical protein